MERVAFLADESGVRLDCMLNPETLEVTRLAGIRPRGVAGGRLTGLGLADDPLHLTSGGRTQLKLDLLFDVELLPTPGGPTDVLAVAIIAIVWGIILLVLSIPSIVASLHVGGGTQ